MSDYRTEAPEILRDFLSYHETIKAHSQRTVDEYYLDLRNFFRYMKQIRDPDLADKSLDEISIMDVDLEFVGSIKLSDIYSYMTYLSRDRVRFQNSSHSDYGLNAASRARKIATIRSFYNYLTNKAHLLRENPVKDIDAPKLKKELPRYLTLEQSKDLLSAVDGKNQERDYAILTLFLNCGLRISELVGLNLQDIQDETMRILGKGNKVRILYLNDACQAALNRYLAVRRPITGRDANALFLSSQNERISRSTVHAMVKKRLLEAGLDATQYSSHKARRRVMVLLVLCCAVFALFLARLAWLQFAMADHYAQKMAEASSASYTLPQHAARGAITDRSGTVLAQDETVYDVYLRVPAPPGTNLRETVNTIAALTGGKDVETQLAAFCSAVSAGELPVTQGLDSIGAAAYYRAGLVQSGAVRLAARGVRRWPDGTILPHTLGFTGPVTAEQWPAARAHYGGTGRVPMYRPWQRCGCSTPCER